MKWFCKIFGHKMEFIVHCQTKKARFFQCSRCGKIQKLTEFQLLLQPGLRKAIKDVYKEQIKSGRGKFIYEL
jgi:hypothetical protein